MCLRDLGEFLCDLGTCQRGMHRIPRCLAGMKSLCFMGWWSKKQVRPLSLSHPLATGSCENQVAHSSQGSMEPMGLLTCGRNMKEFACELELDKSPPPTALSTH